MRLPMPRSHPPTLLTLVQRTLREECRVRRGDRVLVAVSGGGDSAALLHALHCLARKLDLRLHAHGVDHGLRPEARAELDVARRLAERCQVAFSLSCVRVRPGANLQARARAARYEALCKAASRVRAELIATGHHADDRAETVLMRMLRGSGLGGLAVLPARSGRLLRPMIRASRADVLAHLDRHAVDYVQDPSNDDRRFLRVRVRKELLPLLRSLSPRVVEHLTALADQVGEEPPPRIVDANGEVISLGRAQVEQIRRAQQLGLAGARVRLPAGRELSVDPKTGRITLLGAPAAPALAARTARGAAKPRDRG
jgi:tRNA(Ile)-lysidine synthase